jgi:hypothetical protein
MFFPLADVGRKHGGFFMQELGWGTVESSKAPATYEPPFSLLYVIHFFIVHLS